MMKPKLINLIKKIFLITENLKIKFIISFFSSEKKSKLPKLYYGGSRIGDIGGPLVKTKKLNKYFPEQNLNFNIIYLQSNSIYLNTSTLKLLKQKKYPIILNQNGVFYPGWFDGNWKKENLKISHAYHQADFVLWQSNFCKHASNMFLGERKGLGEILYNAVDTNIFIPREKYVKNIFTFLITCNIKRKSNYRISSVIEAFSELVKENKNICLKIIGNIEDQNYFFKKIRKLKLEKKILLENNYSQKDAPYIYADADAYITMTFQDNCPTAVLEAMSCGLPILYSKSGGIPELVGLESGIGLEVKQNWESIKVPTKDQIKNGMQEIIEKRSQMSISARTRSVENFDIKFWIKKQREIFERFLDS